MSADSTSQDDVSFTGELTETGMKVAARSRFVSAIDRLGGNLVDLVGSPIEGWNERRKARIEGEKLLIEAAAKFGVDQLAKGDEFTARVFSNQFGKLAREQTNKDAILEFALEDLRSIDQEPGIGNGNEKLDEVFLGRFDTYAAQATTEALRERWGRVLAAEVRKPGVFSNKVLRIIDELEAETALLFEKVCIHRIHYALPKCLLGKLPFSNVADLSTAGLILEPGLGHVARFTKRTDVDGTSSWLLPLGDYAITLPLDVSLSSYSTNDEAAVCQDGSTPATPIYMLTDVGFAISTILPDRQNEAFEAFALKLRDAVPHGQITALAAKDGGYELISFIPEKDSNGPN